MAMLNSQMVIHFCGSVVHVLVFEPKLAKSRDMGHLHREL